jgi:hypothetical protein
LETKDYLTLVGLFATVILSALSLWVALKNTRQTLFINSVTTSRIRWMDTVRNSIAEFSGLAIHISYTEMNEKDARAVFEKIDTLHFLINLQLDRTDAFDKKIIDQIESIVQLIDPGDDDRRSDEQLAKETQKAVNKLIEFSQDLLKFEWQGIKEEVKNGKLSAKNKKELYRNI